MESIALHCICIAHRNRCRAQDWRDVGDHSPLKLEKTVNLWRHLLARASFSTLSGFWLMVSGFFFLLHPFGLLASRFNDVAAVLHKLVNVLHPFSFVLCLRGPTVSVVWQCLPQETHDVRVPALLGPRLGTTTWPA